MRSASTRIAVIPEDEEQEEPDISARRSDIVALPLVHLHVGYQVSRQILRFFEMDAMDLDTDRYTDATVQFRNQISRNWDVGVGYRIIDRRIDTSDIQSKFDRDHIHLALG